MKRILFVAVACVMACAVAAPAFAAGTESDNDEQYEARRALAEKQAGSPDVAAYATRIASDLDAAVGAALLQCNRRELYSRRAYPDVVLTIAADGAVTDVTVRTVNRMGVCGSNGLKALRLPAPPMAPLYIALDAPTSPSGTPTPR